MVLFVLFNLNGRLHEGSEYPIRDFASRPGTEQTFLLHYVGSTLTPRLPGSTPSSHADPGRLELSLPPEVPGCAHRPWSNPRNSADPLQAISRVS